MFTNPCCESKYRKVFFDEIRIIYDGMEGGRSNVADFFTLLCADQ